MHVESISAPTPGCSDAQSVSTGQVPAGSVRVNSVGAGSESAPTMAIGECVEPAPTAAIHDYLEPAPTAKIHENLKFAIIWNLLRCVPIQ